MIIHVTDFVYGDSLRYDEENGRHFVRGCENIIELHEGDEIIFCHKSQNQKWISSGTITKFNDFEKRVTLDDITSINLEGGCYIGIL